MTINKKVVLLSTLSVFLVGCVFSAMIWGDPVSQIFSTNFDDNIGAWYDETYDASGFYRLEQSGSDPESFYYDFTTTPADSSHTAHWQVGGSSMPCDIVVTEWKASGHVHFSSGM